MCFAGFASKPLLSFNGPIDLLRRDRPLLRKTVRDHGRHCAVEEVQGPVVNASQADAQFVDIVAQEVGLWPPQFVAHLAQALQPEIALVLHFCRQLVEPLDDRT